MKRRILQFTTICSLLWPSLAFGINDASNPEAASIAIDPFKIVVEKVKLKLSVNEKGELFSGDKKLAKITPSGQIFGNDGKLLAKLHNGNLVDKDGNRFASISKKGTIITKENKKYEWNKIGVMVLDARDEVIIQLLPKDSNSKEIASAIIALYFTAKAPNK